MKEKKEEEHSRQRELGPSRRDCCNQRLLRGLENSLIPSFESFFCHLLLAVTFGRLYCLTEVQSPHL